MEIIWVHKNLNSDNSNYDNSKKKLKGMKLKSKKNKNKKICIQVKFIPTEHFFLFENFLMFFTI